MPEPNTTRSLTEISHLFLSEVRNRQTGGAARPVRRPPARHTIDLTPEEFAHVVGNEPADHRADVGVQPPLHEAAVVIASHLGSRQHEAVLDYARHFAVQGQCLGLIEIEPSAVRMLRCERCIGESHDVEPEPISAAALASALREMNWDVERWLVHMSAAKCAEARGLLRQAGQWVVLSTCDHDGIVAAYRTLKGLSDEHPRAVALAMLHPADAAQADRAFQKLLSVCAQFLDLTIQRGPTISASATAATATPVATAPADGSHWGTIGEFLNELKMHQQHEHATEQPDMVETREPGESRPKSDSSSPPPPPPAAPLPAAGEDEVLELTGTDDAALAAAVMQRLGNDLISCPVRPPMCRDAVLAVGRDRSLVLLGIAQHGLREIGTIGQAYRWVVENRPLLAMAMPQMQIDTHRLPRLRLLVDQCDISADVLQPLLQSEHVTVQTYRRLRWGQKMGLLLQAA